MNKRARGRSAGGGGASRDAVLRRAGASGQQGSPATPAGVLPADVLVAMRVFRALPPDCQGVVTDPAMIRPWRRRLAGLSPAELRVVLLEAASRLGRECLPPAGRGGGG